MGSAAKAAVPALAAALKDSNAAVRKHAAEALEKIGPAAKGAVPALAEAVRDAHTAVRKSAADALRNIGPPSAAM